MTIMARAFRAAYLIYAPSKPSEINTHSLHDALPIFTGASWWAGSPQPRRVGCRTSVCPHASTSGAQMQFGRYYEERSEEHTSELQSPVHVVCRLLLVNKNGEISA